jgi:hypothetical protein
LKSAPLPAHALAVSVYVRNAGKSFANIFIDPLVIPQAAYVACTNRNMNVDVRVILDSIFIISLLI